MSSNQDIKTSVERLENLKQATILNSLETIDLSRRIDLYDTMIHLFVKGSLDDDFSSSIFEDIDDSEKEKMHELARKYLSLCFFVGDSDYWADSVEGMTLDNLDFICMRIFDNYNFLLELIKDDKLEVLDNLEAIQATNVFSNKIIIDYLRCSFNDDKLLKEVLTDFVDEDGEYYNLSVKDKALLLLNPEGILYDKDALDKKIDALELKKKIIDYSNISIEPNAISLNELIQKIGKASFKEILLDIYIDYMMSVSNSDIENNYKLFH